MKDFQDIYYKLILEMNEQTVKNVQQNIKFDQSEYEKKIQGYKFVQDYVHRKHSDYVHGTQLEFEFQHQLLDGRQVIINYENQVFYVITPYEPQTLEDPGQQQDIDEAWTDNIGICKNLQDKDNDRLIKIEDKQTHQQILFSSLSLQDRAKIVCAIAEYDSKITENELMDRCWDDWISFKQLDD